MHVNDWVPCACTCVHMSVSESVRMRDSVTACELMFVGVRGRVRISNVWVNADSIEYIITEENVCVGRSPRGSTLIKSGLKAAAHDLI